jgi:hypothetical protein
MVRRSVAVLGVAGGLVAATGAWTLYQRYTTEEVPYTVVARVGDAELRRYPATVLAETTAPTTREAFGRLFAYISGANGGDTEVPMTAPVEMTEGAELSMTAPVEVGGRTVPMTAPVASDRDGEDDDRVRMGFYLPAGYDLESAPRPTDEAVTLVGVPERTLAVRRFRGRATDRRLDRESDRLLATLDRAAVTVDGEPFFMGYDAPWTLPPLRRNEVAVAVGGAD